MDFEDFIYNRTDGSPQSIFKKLGDAATTYVSVVDLKTQRASSLGEQLEDDVFQKVPGLTSEKIKLLCTKSVYKKAKQFEARKSVLISTQVKASQNIITGSYKSVKIYDQEISWCDNEEDTSVALPFSFTYLSLSCECKHFLKETVKTGKCCKHIVGQLRRVIYVNNV